MHFCRICRTETNLKYSTKQLRQQYKRQRSDEHKQLLNTTATLGNICHDCEERLQNFHHLSDDDVDVDDDSSEVDVDGSSISGRSRATTAGSLRRDSPVIVDDDELLYNLFFQKEEQRRKVKRSAESEQRQRLLLGSGGIGRLIGAREPTQLGSDGDTEIIEVLTSRENTPTPAPSLTSSAPLLLPTLVGIQAHNVVAVIDLETEEDAARQAFDSDDEQIVFRSVEPELLCRSSNNNNKKCRKVYAERELRLIASLSLVSSDDDDSEDDSETHASSLSTVTTAATTTTTTETAEPSLPSTPPSDAPLLKPLTHTCTQCSVRLPDAESLQIHERIHTTVACPVCQLGFTASQRLVHHMRRKHRTYEGNTLTERPRCAQDSAMTIRLRYLERYTYYECQLCGRIDAVFKEHKQHVMHQHAAESKSLKDPMMKELRCPICKEKCSTQHVQLARHLLGAHTPKEYRPHLTEVTHTTKHKFGTNDPARHKELERTARIFQFTKRRNCFFECRTCAKVTAGYLNHMEHLKVHARSDDGTTKTPSSQSKAQVLKNTKTNKTKSNVGEKKSKPKPKGASVNNKSQQKQTNNHKPNHTSKTVAAAAAPVLKTKQKPRQRHKLTKKALQMALVKVKVKPPLRQFRTQKYKCKFCQLVFKGFHRLNLHQLTEHVGDEYRRCSACTRAFTSDTNRAQHERKNHDKSQFGGEKVKKQTRKRAADSSGSSSKNVNELVQAIESTMLVDENCNTACKRPRLNLSLTPWTSKKTFAASRQSSPPPPPLTDGLPVDVAATNATPPPNWLQDLLQLQQKNSFTAFSVSLENTTASSLLHQCRYCTHLMRTATELSAHVEAVHDTRQEMQIIKRCAIGTH